MFTVKMAVIDNKLELGLGVSLVVTQCMRIIDPIILKECTAFIFKG